MADQLIAQETERSMMMLTRPGYAAPSLIVAVARLEGLGLTVNLDVRVDQGGTVRVTAVRVQSSAPGAVTSRALRAIRLDQLARDAVQQLESPVSMRDDIAPGAFQVAGEPADQAWISPVPGRRQASPELAEQAARIYAAAVAEGSGSPTMAVAHRLGYSRSQASRFIKAAREAGLLDPAITKEDK